MYLILCWRTLCAWLAASQRWSCCTEEPAPVAYTTGSLNSQLAKTFQCLDQSTGLLTLIRFLLLGAATSMGAVAIWSMHYIGDQAIEMMGGQPEFRITYKSEFTGGSFVLPIGVVAIAFYCFHQSETINAYGTVIGGFTTGLAACGMHYTGEGGVSNYDLSYKWSYVFCSAIVGVIANTVGLGVFFYLHASWKDFYLKRIACASLIAAAVTSMHWIATFGTLYRLNDIPNGNNAALSRRAVVIIVIALVGHMKPSGQRLLTELI